jgi:hypothetical protein
MPGRLRALGALQAATLGLACALLPVLGPATARAQQGTGAITGRLVDRESHTAIRGARIALLGTRRGFASDSEGRFVQDSLAAGNYVLQVRAIGYVGASWVLQLAAGQVRTQDFELERLPVQLDPVTVRRPPSFSEQRRLEFERRRASGRGYFITEDDIERTKPHSLSDLFRNVPGVRLTCRGSSNCAIRMTRAPRECRPDFVLDGFAASNSTSLDMATVGIIGIEVYRTLTETPTEFLKADNLCGTVVIWTRSGPRGP